MNAKVGPIYVMQMDFAKTLPDPIPVPATKITTGLVMASTVTIMIRAGTDRVTNIQFVIG